MTTAERSGVVYMYILQPAITSEQNAVNPYTLPRVASSSKNEHKRVSMPYPVAAGALEKDRPALANVERATY
jgi:hypothetical protein